MTGLRVTSLDPRLTRVVRSWVGAEERARRVALLVGEATIEQRDRAGDWSTVERFTRTRDRVSRVEGQP
jgi:hypothetical protein